MLTALGKFLRKIRIDRGEILKDMADRLEVSVAFLSAVENGKKKIPGTWEEKIAQVYQFDDFQRFHLRKAIAETNKVVEMNLEGLNAKQIEVAVSFARIFPDFTEAELMEIQKLIKGKKA